MAQLALAWLIAKPGVCAIAGARSAEQITDSADAAAVSFTESELDEMDRISQPVRDLIDDDPVLWKW
jgi:aryl-alcohol dehydrogenase-like predicted oxidoreductase